MQTRLFLALWPTPAVRAELAARRDDWRWPRSASPVASERLHMTLHFLGNLPSERLTELADGLAVPFQPFELRLDQPVLWPHGIAVLEPSTAPERLLRLQAALGEALHALAVPLDARPYRPHVTLARRASAAAPPEPGSPVHWRVRGYALMESRTGFDAGYHVLRRYA